MVSAHKLMQRCSSCPNLGSSKPNMSRMPMKPSVACLTALFKAAIDLLPALVAPMVDAC